LVSSRRLLLILTIAGLSAGRADASLPPPESTRLPFTIDEAAALTVAPWEFVLEASVERSEPIIVYQASSCLWVTEMWLRPTKQIWGRISDSSFRVVTAAVREDSLSRAGCGFVPSLEEDASPPPEAGEKGIFLLSYGLGQIVENVPALMFTRCGFLPRQPDGSVRVCLLGLTYSYAYDDFVAALDRRVHALTIESASEMADTIVIGRLEAVGNWHVEQSNGVTRAGLRLTVDKMIRGKSGRNPLVLLPVATHPGNAHTVAQDITAGRLAGWMKTLSSRKVLVFARKEGETLVPVGIGLLEVSGRDVYLKEQRIEDGRVKRIYRPLSEVKAILNE